MTCRVTIKGLIVCLLLVCPRVLLAQDRSLRELASIPTAGVSLESVSAAPQSYWAVDGLLVVRCLVKNGDAQPASGTIVGRAVGNLGDEDRRQFQIGPNETRTYDFQVRLPTPMPESKADIEVSLFVRQGDKEVLVVRGDEPATRNFTFWRHPKNRLITALSFGVEPLPPLPWRWEPTKVFSTYELAIASRVDAELSKDCIAFESTPFPLNPIDWRGIDNLILGESSYLRDAGTRSVLRDYLNDGGRVWIMLDDIDTAPLSGLLTSQQQLVTLDTVELTNFVVDAPKQSISLQDRTVELSSPVRFKRVMQHGGVVPYSIDGWPACVIFPVGRGELMVTTLESAAWIEPRKNQWSQDPFFQSDYELRRFAKGLVDKIHTKRSISVVNLKDVSYPMEKIGNPVVSRGFVASVLLLFCGALISFGLWRGFLGELKWVGFLAPALAVLAALPLIAAAWLQKRDIPSMVSVFQLVQFSDPTGGMIRETAAVYNGDSKPMQLRSESAGYVVPDPAIDGGIKTITTEDFQRWGMSNIAWPTGVWKYNSAISIPDTSMLAVAEFTSDGLSIQIPTGLPAPLKDPVLCYMVGAPTLAKSLDSQRILVDGSYPAEGERWTLDSIVDSEQLRRNSIYKKLFESSDRLQAPSRTLFGWTEAFSRGGEWNPSLEKRGIALVSIPLALATPKAGSEVFVPYTMIDVRSADVGSSSPIYLEGIGRWVNQSSNKSEAFLEFILPSQVTPMDVASIEIDFDVQAPRRMVRLSSVGIEDAPPIEIASLNEPSIPYKATIEDPRILQAFQDGTLIVKIEISDDREPDSSIPWRIKHLRLSARGKTRPRDRFEGNSSP
ncbi:MAG: hypothetical protein ACK52S_17920 [Pirellula sp.]